ncbi:MAG: acylphosphatase [Sphingobacterium sp.]|uniref:acylphosphatase n=1 Tax=Sphingobacterium sp. JB170 TaxID=1434842 RepID=UPI00097F1110|nr:acylphosphatase [Sphingobacterium sp. JB170]SJN50132.1 Acylphosphate phosphohydrolase, putative [Sphingobacterium sp. JB170]
MKHYVITVTGKVQGVYFRDTCKAVADQLGVKGFVRNNTDGSVYIEAEGDDFALGSFLEFCHEGTDRAEVTSVDHTESVLQHFQNFAVLRKKK